MAFSGKGLSRLLAVAVACASPTTAPAQQASVERRPQPLDWEAAEASRAATEARLDPSLTRAVSETMSTDLARTRLPVLAPGLPEVVARGRLVSQGDSYVFITSDDGAKITVHGTSIAAEVASPSAELERMVEAAAETAVRVELTEEGIDASLRRFGASYLVRITCADPADRRCSEEGYARELARSLAVIGGSPQP